MFKLSKKGMELVQAEMKRYETKYSAIIPALYCAQKENGGWINNDVIEHLSEIMQISSSKINEVFHFYTLFNKSPIGKYHVQVCCNISCSMNGGRELAEHILKTFNISEGELTSDGKLSLTKVECLGSCGTAPMMQVNETYYENLTPEKAVQILKELE